jgi:CDP-glucose 4,6-dehydratase
MVRSEGRAVDIRSPEATRPWQHVLEPLSGYLLLGASLQKRADLNGEAYNFGPPAHQNNSVRELIDTMASYWDSVCWNDVSVNNQGVHEAGLLKLNCDKALFDLEWQPTLEFEDTVRMTAEWYKAYYEGNSNSMREFTISQIEEYTAIAKEKKAVWAEE